MAALISENHKGQAEQFPLLITAEQSMAALADGALLVDIRAGAGRVQHGYFGVGIAVEKSDLLTAFSPSSRLRRQDLPNEKPILFFCSSDVTAMRFVELLREIGVANACNVAGGYQALLHAGIPLAGTVDGK